MLLEGARAHSAQTKEDTVRVVVLGAATPLGQQVVEDLAFRGHRPTAALATAPEGEARWQHLVAVAVGDITDPHWLDATVSGAEAVVDVLSVATHQ